MKGMRRAGLAFIVLIGLAAPARADLQLCNRMSYVIEAAIGIEEKGSAATRGWFRIDPGQCKSVLNGTLTAEHIYVHARALPVYGGSPMPESGNADLCVAEGDFVIAAARACPRGSGGQRLVRFTEVKPSETEQGLTANLAEDAEYTDEQAKLAGIQRLLGIIGYDASPIDGVQGPKTEAAIAQFIKDRRLASDAAGAPDFFNTLIDAAQRPDGAVFAWCNDTPHQVMAALGAEEKSGIVTRGWYRVEPGKCLRPDVNGQPKRLYSFGEAVDADGHAVRRGGVPLAWGGDVKLCTREVKFELGEHKDCGAAGLTSSGFAAIDMTGRGAVTVRFR